MQMKAVSVLDFFMFIPSGFCSLNGINPHQVYTECKTREKRRMLQSPSIKLEMFTLLANADNQRAH